MITFEIPYLVKNRLLTLSCDGNGNVLSLTKATDGTQAASYEYSPFGELLRITGTAAKFNVIRFSTKYEDIEAGLLYYGHRFYSLAMKKWLNRDPIGERGGINLSAVVGNDMVNRFDILGLKDWTIVDYFNLGQNAHYKLRYGFEVSTWCDKDKDQPKFIGPKNLEWTEVSGPDDQDVPDEAGFGLGFDLGPFSAGGKLKSTYNVTVSVELDNVEKCPYDEPGYCVNVSFKVDGSNDLSLAGEAGIVSTFEGSLNINSSKFRPKYHKFRICCCCGTEDIKKL